jgi:hypothetical protein
METPNAYGQRAGVSNQIYKRYFPSTRCSADSCAWTINARVAEAARSMDLTATATSLWILGRTLFVVLFSPDRNLTPRVKQVPKPAHHQAPFPHPTVKAFYSRILRRLSRLNVHQLDLPFHAPRQKMPASELRPVVTADRLGPAPLRDDLVQHSRTAPPFISGWGCSLRTLSRNGLVLTNPINFRLVG